MQNSVAKKIFAVGSAVAMTLSLSVPFVAFAAVHGAGTNVSTSDGTVWYITNSNTKRAYTSAGAFLSYGFNSWSQVVPASAEDIALPTDSAGFIPPQDGTVFCATSTKGSDVSGECSLVTGGTKAAYTSAAVFTGLGFSFARAQYGDSSFLNKTSNIDNTTAAHRTGVLVHFVASNGNDTVFLVGPTSLLGIPDLATFNSWGYSFANAVPANAADKAMPQSGVMAVRMTGQLNPTWNTTPTPTPTPGVVSGSVSASLAADTPASQTIAVTGSSTLVTVATLAKFNFSGSGTVTQLQVKRTGVSPDSIITNAYLYNGDTRLTDAASIGGNSTISFNNGAGLFTVSGSMTVSVVVEITGNAGAGQTVGLQLVSYTVANGTATPVSISGNVFTTSTATDLAYAQFGTVTPGDSASQTRDAAIDTEVFRSQVTVNQRDMTMSRLIVRNIGTIQQADLRNFRLRIDGTQVAQAQSMDANGYVYFSFSPVTVKAGTRTLSILADVISGASRTFQFQIRNKADVNFTDTQYNTSVSLTNTFPVGSSNAVTINSGTMTIVKASDSPSGNVTDGASDVTLAKFTATAYGEAMKIETLTAGASSSDASVGSLRNGRLFINGVQYGSTATLATTTTGTTFTVNYTVQPGTPITIEVHADMFDNDAQGNSLSDAASETVTAHIYAGSSNVQKMVSLGYISVPSAIISGSAVTNVVGSASLSKNATYANQSTPLPRTNYKLGAYNLVGSSSEDINVNSIDLAFTSSTTAAGVLNNVRAVIAGNTFGTIKSSAAASSTGTVSATTTFSGNYLLQKSQTVTVEIWGDIPNATPNGSDTYTTRIAVNGTTVNSTATIMAAASGQTISVGTASLTAAVDGSNPVAALVAGSQTKTAAVFKFSALTDQFTISEVILSIATNTTVSNVILKDSSGILATLPGGASSTFSNLSIVIPANTTKVLTVDIEYGTVGVGAGTTGEQVQVLLDSYKEAPSSTGAITQRIKGTSVAGNTFYVYKAIPTITNVALPTSTLIAGTNTLAKFTISTGGNNTIGWAKLLFTISTSSGVSVTAPTLWEDGGSQVTGLASTTLVNAGVVYFEFLPTSEQQVSGSKTYIIKGTVGGSGLTTGSYVSTSIANTSTTFGQPALAATASTTVATFTWSDQVGSASAAHSLTTADWNNDFLVKNLPTDSQTLTK